MDHSSLLPLFMYNLAIQMLETLLPSSTIHSLIVYIYESRLDHSYFPKKRFCQIENGACDSSLCCYSFICHSFAKWFCSHSSLRDTPPPLETHTLQWSFPLHLLFIKIILSHFAFYPGISQSPKNTFILVCIS